MYLDYLFELNGGKKCSRGFSFISLRNLEVGDEMKENS